MTWGWAVRGDNLGTPAESAVKAAWPDYNAEYLKKKLNGQKRRFDADDLDDIEKHVYLQQSVKGYEAEAEACLKEEFKQWLQGTHDANVQDEMGNGYYVNNDGGSGPKRRHVYDGVVSAEMADNGAQGTGWRATRWGTKQLTHLDGVCDFLRAGRIQQDNAERDMNLLAERGPQDLNEAWMYFKHWVKKRPVTTCDEFGPPEQKIALDYYQVDRMNGTGPSNWNSQTKPTFDRPWEVPSWMGQDRAEDAPVKPEPTPPGPSLGNYYDLPARSNPMSDISQAYQSDEEPDDAMSDDVSYLGGKYDAYQSAALGGDLSQAFRDNGLDDSYGDWSDDEEPDQYNFPAQANVRGTKHPAQPHDTGTKRKVGFTAQVSQSQIQRPPPGKSQKGLLHRSSTISGTKRFGNHQMLIDPNPTAPNKAANIHGFQRDRGAKRPNPAMDHVWATNQANQALKRAHTTGFQFGL